MNSDNSWFCLLLIAQLLLWPGVLQADDEFTFELDEIEKKPLQWGGYAELKFDHQDIDGEAALTALNNNGEPSTTISRLNPSLQIDGSYLSGISSFNWLLKAAGQKDNFGWTGFTDIYEAYGRIKPNTNSTIDIGKQAYKWGKGYAWNPVGFINRPKDPNDPQESLEGYVTGEVDLVKSFEGALRNIALTTVLLPVYGDVNSDFGVEDNLNLAANLYLLFMDTDIDFIFYTGNSRSTRIGADFSRNITSNFEIHGEAAYISSEKKLLLLEDETTRLEDNAVFKSLLGIRYLTENDLTAIIEYYFNGNGYTEEERSLFYQLVADETAQVHASNTDVLFERIRELSLRGYGKPYMGRNYLYARFTQKEPFDILYLTPGLTTIVNLDDGSTTITPELAYTGFTNWEMRLRFSMIVGGSETEYGEKQTNNKIEFRLRWFF